ncbi:hypothetical protein TIFTF001_047288 [Ficus carica]|uniref:peroxidase n=1 Tax=Ficus carica TaxID=3494 RepID=A0AA87Z4J4_FICCA|nr:hypothetical protein TIFTF001_047288 [Ficus carica]
MDCEVRKKRFYYSKRISSPEQSSKIHRSPSNFDPSICYQGSQHQRLGSHTIGQAQCVTFRDRVNSNASDIDAGFASTRRRRCPTDVTKENTTLAPLDLVTPNQLDNNYFKNLLQKKGLLASDQILFSGGSTDSIVTEYSKSPSKFSSDFA